MRVIHEWNDKTSKISYRRVDLGLEHRIEMLFLDNIWRESAATHRRNENAQRIRQGAVALAWDEPPYNDFVIEVQLD